jgi:hypothetical protein
VSAQTPGSIDTSFDPGFGLNGGVHSIAVQTDGKILIGGYFSDYNGTPRNNITRVNPNGSIDSSFNPGYSTSGGLNCIALQMDGKILDGGVGFRAVEWRHMEHGNRDHQLEPIGHAG